MDATLQVRICDRIQAASKLAHPTKTIKDKGKKQCLTPREKTIIQENLKFCSAIQYIYITNGTDAIVNLLRLPNYIILILNLKWNKKIVFTH